MTADGTAPTAAWDRLTTAISALVVLALVPTSVTIAITAPGATKLWGVGMLGLLAFGWALSPRGYRLDDRELVIERRAASSRRLPGVTGVRHATADDPHRLTLFSTLRLMGSGGLFGWYGSFWNRRAGRYLAYVTDRSTRVIVERRDDADVLISPADPDAFVRRWREPTP